MMRAGQPLTGTNGRRCKEDEKLINATLRPGKRGYIIDTRTINVAQQAKARGGGFESEANYPQWRRIHKAVERWVLWCWTCILCAWRVQHCSQVWSFLSFLLNNKFSVSDSKLLKYGVNFIFICMNHTDISFFISRSNVLQESLIKLVEACNDQTHSMDRWLSKLEASSWQTHVKEILTTACLAAQCIDRSGNKVFLSVPEIVNSHLLCTHCFRGKKLACLFLKQ